MQIQKADNLSIKLSLILFIILTITAACGGGGGGSEPSTPSTTVVSNALQVQFSRTVLEHFQDQVLTLQNNGNTRASIGVIAQSDPLNVPFSITDDQCSGKTLAPSEACMLKIQFLPVTQNLFMDTFDIPSETGQPIMIVNISGESVALNASINQVDKSGCTKMRLFVAVTDKQDGPVTSLTQDNFLVFEEGELQVIDSFSNQVTTPISVAMVLDYSGSMQPLISDVESAAKSFIDQLDLNNGTDEAMIIKFAASVETKQPFTDDYDSLVLAIGDNYTGNIDQTHLYDAVWQAIESAADPSRTDRRAVVVLTDGIDEGSIDHQMAEVVENANEKGVPVFTIGLGNVFISTLQHLADETGGQYFLSPTSNELQSIYQSIAEILTNQYIIEYDSPTAGGDVIDLDIEIDQNGLKGEDSKSITGC